MAPYKFRRVIDFEVKPGASKSISTGMSRAGGFEARAFAEAVQALSDMWQDRGCSRIISFTADLVSTGLRGVLRQLVRDKKFDLIITTCGTLDHDIARCFSPYLEGDFGLDDRLLLKKGFHRLGNVLIPKDSYGPTLERFIQPLLTDLYPGKGEIVPPHQLIWEAGKRLDNRDSILYWAYVNKIPVVVPGITDGAFGSQLWLYYQAHRGFQLDLMTDEQLMSDFVFDARRLGALMLGGGISKHHTIWWAQFKGGLDYAIYLTTAVEYDGSLSGALLKEAISWGKVKPRARQTTVHGDVTVLLPYLVSAAL